MTAQDVREYADNVVRMAKGGIRRYGVKDTSILFEGVARVEMLDGRKCCLRLADDDGGWEPGSRVVSVFEATHTILEAASDA
jgi:hypothetical protein